MLKPFNKERRLESCMDFLELVDAVCVCIMIVDETWIRQYDLEFKHKSMQWIKKGERAPKKFKMEKSAQKLMTTVFWDRQGILLIDYLPKRTTVNGQYYANLLAQGREAIVQKRRGTLGCDVLCLQDIAPVHTARILRPALSH